MAEPTSCRSIRIVSDKPDFTGAQVWVDGKPVDELHAVSVRVAVPELNKVVLEFTPDSLEIEMTETEVTAEPPTRVF